MKIIDFHYRIMEIMKILKIIARITNKNIMNNNKKIEFNVRINKFMKTKLRIRCENDENNWNHKIKCEKLKIMKTYNCL